MKWVTRTAERILRAPTSATEEPPRAEHTDWHALDALDMAVRRHLAGSDDGDPAAEALAGIPAGGRCLVIAARPDLIERLRSALPDLQFEAAEPRDWLAPEAMAEPVVADAPLFDAVLLECSGLAAAGADAPFSRLAAHLRSEGVLWLHLLAEPPAATAQLRRQLDALLALVPARWRLRQSCQPGEVNPAGPVLSARPQIEAALKVAFEVAEAKPCGGTLLGPLFAAGCIDPAIDADEEGRALLAALYRTEIALIERGELACEEAVYRCRRRAEALPDAAALFAEYAPPLPEAAKAGMAGPVEPWIAFNLGEGLTGARASEHIAPFPPPTLMHNTTGLTQNRDFAQHGADILAALSAASPVPLNGFGTVLDFGVGVGRTARYFKGFGGRYVGLDIDRDNLDWIGAAMPWVEAVANEPNAPIPLPDGSVDAVISISVFTHIDAEATAFYVAELRRVLRPGGFAYLTLHGETALGLALAEERVARLMAISAPRLAKTQKRLAQSGFDFIEQYTHLTQDRYRYGTTFFTRTRAEQVFGEGFTVKAFVPGAIHAFQDLIVLERG